MAHMQSHSQADMVKVMRDLIAQVEAGEVEIQNIAVMPGVDEGPCEDGYRTYRATNLRTMEIAYRVNPKP